jgi:hypothetical protein
MNRTIRSFSILAILAGVVLAQAQDEVTLRRVYTEGAVDKYTVKTQMESTTDMTAMGQESMTMKLTSGYDFTITTKSVDKEGNALLELLASNMDTKMDASGPMGEAMNGADMPKELKASAKGSPFSVLTELKMLGERTAGMAMMTGGANPLDSTAEIIFPKDPIKVGATFEVEAKEGGLYAKGAKFTGKLTGEAEVNGVKVWTLEYSGTPKMMMDIGKAMAEGNAEGMPPMNIMLEQVVTIKTKVSVAKDSGKIVSYSSVYSSDGAVKLPDMGIEFPATSVGTSTITAKAAK